MICYKVVLILKTNKVYQTIIVLIMVALLGSCSSRTTPAPVVDIGAGKTLKKSKVNSNVGNTYVVAKGDTLFSIAWYANKDFKTLARINNISAPYRIYPNQKLLLTESRQKTDTPQPKPPKKYQKTQKSESNRTKTYIAVDPPKKQAYGDSTNVVQNNNIGSNGTINWQWPSSGNVISRFSLTEKGNKGIDLADKLGSPILATADGKVVYTGNALRGYGNLVIVKHNEDYLSAYAHNDEILVKEQQRVQTGQLIARMGNSGTQRTKLHFEIRYKGKSVDPLRHLPPK
jgi:lipoprotein NlpD